MILQSSASLYFGLSALVIVALHLLRTRLRRREVSTILLWEGLRGDPRAHSVKLRQLIDPFLLLQILALLALVAALAQPEVVTQVHDIADLAIVVDGSASMQSLDDAGVSRYERAIAEARSTIERYSADSITIAQLTSHPTVLSPSGASRSQASRALADSAPTWFADGSLDDLANILAPQGGLLSFDRILYFSDRELTNAPAWVDQTFVEGGRNRGITGFSVRENPTEDGVVAFVKVTSEMEDYEDATIRIGDGFVRVALSVVLPPGSSEQYVIPFPNSRGTAFTATLEPSDGFTADDTRHFALDRPLSLRLRWIGETERYTLAALSAVLPITMVGSSEQADLTVVRNTEVPASLPGNLLLIGSEMSAVFEFGADLSGVPVAVGEPNHPLVNGIDPGSIRVFSLPEMSVPAESTVVLTAGGSPLLVEYAQNDRTIHALAPDVGATNLPVTVDFPLLIRNILGRITRLPAALSYDWTLVGDPVRLTGLGAILALVAPNGSEIQLDAARAFFLPEAPGLYALTTERGVFPIAVNVAPGESVDFARSGDTSSDLVTGRLGQVLLPLWPYVAAFAALLLIAETAGRNENRSTRRRAG
ncbi:MAG: VWA domain-containing protein [Candidatus Bipolaricaulia bacterium]